MSNKQFKTVQGTNVHKLPNTKGVSANEMLLGKWARNTMVAQDSAFDVTGRQVLQVFGLGITEGFGTVPNTGESLSETAGQQAPTKTDWREIARSRFTGTPGAMFRVRAEVLPSGQTQGASGSLWVASGKTGEIRVSLTGTIPGNSVSTSVTLDLPVAEHPSGSLPTQQSWFKYSTVQGPEDLAVVDFGADDNVTDLWTDKVVWELVWEHRGAVRLIDGHVHEVPKAAAFLHTSGSDTSVHAYTKPDWTPYPQTAEQNGVVYTEPRHGTLQTADVMANQIRRLGPSVMTWTAYDEKTATVSESLPRLYFDAVNDSGWKCLWDTSLTSWAADSPGLYVPSAVVQRHDITDEDQILKGRASSMPCRVSVYYQMTNATTTGSIRVQSSPSSFYEFPLPNSTSPTWAEALCHLEGGVFADDSEHNLMVFFNGAQDPGGGDGSERLILHYASICYEDDQVGL